MEWGRQRTRLPTNLEQGGQASCNLCARGTCYTIVQLWLEANVRDRALSD